MQGHFHSVKSLFDVLQLVGVICNYLNNLQNVKRRDAC